MSERIDIGHGHFITGTCWAPDRTLNPRYAHPPFDKDVDDWGLTIEHPDGKNPGQTCMSAVTFDGPVQRQLAPDNARWKVESLEPLTLSPSILCRRCGDHGYIREGRWVPA